METERKADLLLLLLLFVLIFDFKKEYAHFVFSAKNIFSDKKKS